jgi:uncharacterized membrane protein HdeD (DUF308 family)
MQNNRRATMTPDTTNPRAVLRQGASSLCNRTWWVFLIGGIASVIFGILAFVNPGVALVVLSMFFAAWVLVDGAVNIWGAITHRDKQGWWVILLLGVAGFLAGGYALLRPPISILAFLYVVAFIAMFIGLTSIYLGWKIREEIPNEWLLYLTGALSVIFALVVMFQPGIGSVTIVYMIASWALLIGALRIWFAFRVRGLRDRLEA